VLHAREQQAWDIFGVLIDGGEVPWLGTLTKGETMSIRFTEEAGGYLHTEALPGVKTFALSPVFQAAHSCFGKEAWPDDLPVPQAWLELDVDDVEEATAELESRGARLLIKNKREPWGQTVSRFLSPEGLLVGLTFTPALRKQ
jgi:glyoxalase/bleomycin resistance protein/dioxygenase superfamily protein